MDLSPPIKRLVMVGACYVDTILSVPNFPREDDKLRATSLARRRGGNVANSLQVLEQFSDLDVQLALICVLPDESSPGVQFVRDSLSASRVDLSHCIYRRGHQEPASSYILKARDSGSRTIVNYNELPEMTFEEFRGRYEEICGDNDDDGDGGRCWVHFEGREVQTSLECLRWLRRRDPGCVLSVEVEKPKREGLEAMAAEADVVFFSRTWAEAAGYSSPHALFMAQAETLVKAKLVCCTWGAEGAALGRPVDKFFFHDRPKLTDGRIVDSIGAGDTFVAGILYQLLKRNYEEDAQTFLKEAASFANRLAGRKILQEGFAGLIAER